jgi:hypothetical protein
VKFKDQQIGLLDANVQHLLAQAKWRKEFEHPWIKVTQWVTQSNGIFNVKMRMTGEWLYSVEDLMEMPIGLFQIVSF